MKSLTIPNHNNPQPREVSLDEIFEVVDGCRRCPLGECHNNPEMGIGNEQARILVLVDTPANQDYHTRMKGIEKLMEPAGVNIDDVYVTSLVKCTVPPGRNLLPFEIEECSAILREEIRSVWPQVIVSMGNTPTQFLLHSDIGVNPLEGRMYRRGHFQILPTYHINQLLRDPRSMKSAQETMKKLGDWLQNNPSS